MARRGLMHAGLLLVLGGLLGSGCQQYEFEELPSSVIKESRWERTVTISAAADILFVIDNSGSMVGEQLQLGGSFGAFTSEIEDAFGDDYRIAVVTTGVESPGCPPCGGTYPSSCMNETGESGRFQNRLGHNDGTILDPNFSFTTDPNCPAVMSAAQKSCFYDTASERGIALVGTNGCGYERGLEPVRLALSELQAGQPFLRENATLAIIIVSDEEDCGRVGDVTEGISNVGGDICYYSSNGRDPEERTNEPDTGKPYELTPIDYYYNEFMKLKGNQVGMVKFAAIVGVTDPEDPSTTEITYYWDDDDNRYRVNAACETPGCKAQCPPPQDPNNPAQQRKYKNCLTACEAKPGVRYINLVEMFKANGDNGFIDTICQNNFSATMKAVGEFVRCPKIFKLNEPILHPDLANILINDQEVPRYSCGFTDQVRLVECSGPDDGSCPDGVDCVPTWTYQPPTDPPDPKAKGGTISFASHYDPCEFFETGESVHIELVYVIP